MQSTAAVDHRSGPYIGAGPMRAVLLVLISLVLIHGESNQLDDAVAGESGIPGMSVSDASIAEADQLNRAQIQRQLIAAKRIQSEGAKTEENVKTIIQTDQRAVEAQKARVAAAQRKLRLQTARKDTIKTPRTVSLGESKKAKVKAKAKKAKGKLHSSKGNPAQHMKIAHMHITNALKSHDPKKNGMSKEALIKARDAVKKVALATKHAKKMKMRMKKGHFVAKAAKAGKANDAIKRKIEREKKAVKKAEKVAKRSRKKSVKKKKISEKTAKAIAKAKVEEQKWNNKPLHERVKHWKSTIKRVKDEAKEAVKKKNEAETSSAEHRNKMKQIIVDEVKKGLRKAAGPPHSHEAPAHLLEMLQESGGSAEISSTAMDEQASEVAQKAFKWEQSKRDRAFAKRFKEHKAEEQAAQEKGFKREKATEMYEKQKSRREEAVRAQVNAQQKESWEIAAKAYKYVGKDVHAKD